MKPFVKKGVVTFIPSFVATRIPRAKGHFQEAGWTWKEIQNCRYKLPKEKLYCDQNFINFRI